MLRKIRLKATAVFLVVLIMISGMVPGLDGFVLKASAATYYEWRTVGSAGSSVCSGEYTSIAVVNGMPLVVYSDANSGDRTSVQCFRQEGSWNSLGESGFSYGCALYTDIAIDSSGTPYVV